MQWGFAAAACRFGQRFLLTCCICFAQTIFVAAQTESRADLSGAYAGEINYPEADMKGAATLTVNGNEFVLQNGSNKSKRGRITAIDSRGGYVSVTMMFEDGKDSVEQMRTVLSLRLVKTGKKSLLISAPGETRQFSFELPPELKSVNPKNANAANVASKTEKPNAPAPAKKPSEKFDEIKIANVSAPKPAFPAAGGATGQAAFATRAITAKADDNSLISTETKTRAETNVSPNENTGGKPETNSQSLNLNAAAPATNPASRAEAGETGAMKSAADELRRATTELKNAIEELRRARLEIEKARAGSPLKTSGNENVAESKIENKASGEAKPNKNAEIARKSGAKGKTSANKSNTKKAVSPGRAKTKKTTGARRGDSKQKSNAAKLTAAKSTSESVKSASENQKTLPKNVKTPENNPKTSASGNPKPR